MNPDEHKRFFEGAIRAGNLLDAFWKVASSRYGGTNHEEYVKDALATAWNVIEDHSKECWKKEVEADQSAPKCEHALKDRARICDKCLITLKGKADLWEAFIENAILKLIAARKREG